MVQFHFFVYDCPVFPTPFIEEAVLSSLYILSSFVVNYLTICVGLFLGSLFCPIDLCVFMPVPYSLNFYSLVIEFEIMERDASCFVLSQDCFDFSEIFMASLCSVCLFWFGLYFGCRRVHVMV